jgi:hypothetical protein
MTLYGYYSDKQYQNNGIIYVYRDNDKKEKFLTEVSSRLRTDDELTMLFDDNKFMGEVYEFVRTEKDSIIRSQIIRT